MNFLETLDKDALFVSPIANPLAKEKLETKLIGLTRKSKTKSKKQKIPTKNFKGKKIQILANPK